MNKPLEATKNLILDAEPDALLISEQMPVQIFTIKLLIDNVVNND